MEPASPWSRRLFYAGAALIGLIGVAHLLIVISTVCFGLVCAAPFRPAALRSRSYR